MPPSLKGHTTTVLSTRMAPSSLDSSMRHHNLPRLVCEINKLSPDQLTASQIARLQSHQPSSLKWPPRSARWVIFGVVQPLRRVLREKVHSMSLSSIHIDYNHTPAQALRSLPGRCSPQVISFNTEVVGFLLRGLAHREKSTATSQNK